MVLTSDQYVQVRLLRFCAGPPVFVEYKAAAGHSNRFLSLYQERFARLASLQTSRCSIGITKGLLTGAMRILHCFPSVRRPAARDEQQEEDRENPYE